MEAGISMIKAEFMEIPYFSSARNYLSKKKQYFQYYQKILRERNFYFLFPQPLLIVIEMEDIGSIFLFGAPVSEFFSDFFQTPLETYDVLKLGAESRLKIIIGRY